MLLDDSSGFWTGLEEPIRSQWIQRSARQCAEGIVEQEACSLHPASEVQEVVLHELGTVGSEGESHRYRFVGQARSVGQVIGRRSHVTTVTCNMNLVVDRYGRVLDCQQEILSRQDRRLK